MIANVVHARREARLRRRGGVLQLYACLGCFGIGLELLCYTLDVHAFKDVGAQRWEQRHDGE